MTSTPRIVFVTEAGPEVGWGHLARCLALARAAGEAKARSFFVVGDDAGALARVRSAGFEAVALPWRGAPDQGLEAICDLAAAADVAVVDSYAAGLEFLVALRSAVGRLVIVDDLADRPLPADVIVNGGLGAERLPYPAQRATRVLLGPRYALLDPDFANPPMRDAADRVTRVLVTLGGSRPGAAVRAAIDAVDRVFADCHIDVAVASADGASDLEHPAHAGRNVVTVHQGQPGLRGLMLGADLAVAGGGVTLLELAATATPVVVVEMADNQQPNIQASVSAGFALKAGTAGDVGLGQRIEAALRQLALDATGRRQMGARGRELVDGRGASRVVEAVVEAAVVGR